jgi:hypothetical protein
MLTKNVTPDSANSTQNVTPRRQSVKQGTKNTAFQVGTVSAE